MNKKPMVSIIIPIFNIQQYVEQCLNSVTSQTYDRLEIIIIDDGSTDNTGLIADKFRLKDNRLIVMHTENHGLSSARNIGLEKAHGEFIAFLDGDDWIEVDAIEVLVKHALKNDADIVASRIYREWMNATEESQMPSDFEVYNADEACQELICKNHIGCGVWNKLYRAYLFSKVGFPEGRVFEDIATTYRLLLLAKKVVWIPDMLFHYRMRASSITHSYNPKSALDRWYAFYDMYINLYDKKQYRKALIQNCMNVIRRYWFMYGHKIKQSNEFERTIIKILYSEFRNFAYSHRQEILKGEYSAGTKLICVFALCDEPCYLWLMGVAYAICKSIIKKEERLELKEMFE